MINVRRVRAGRETMKPMEVSNSMMEVGAATNQLQTTLTDKEMVGMVSEIRFKKGDQMEIKVISSLDLHRNRLEQTTFSGSPEEMGALLMVVAINASICFRRRNPRMDNHLESDKPEFLEMKEVLEVEKEEDENSSTLTMTTPAIHD